MTGSKHDTRARRSCTQSARWFLEMTTLTWMANRYTTEEITVEIDEAGTQAEKVNWDNH